MIKNCIKMNKRALKIILYPLVSVFISSMIFSCEEYLTVEPENVLLPEQFYRDKFDADAAVRGIYGKLINMAPQYVILNELRADLMDVTDNADQYLRQINLHNVKEYNPWADPRPFYSLVNDCNDALSNFNIMLMDLKMSREEYDQRYSDIGTLRCWLYLQLAIHYGNVPYITFPVDNVDDLGKLDDPSIPYLNIEQMVDSLLNFMESLPYTKLYTDPSLTDPVDGYDPRVIYIDKEFFLGDLYLWKGEYLKAASYYKTIMERNTGINEFDSYKIPYGDLLKLENLDKFNSSYIRYYYYDINSVVNHWPWMFQETQTNDFYMEWIWVMYYDDKYAPFNPFLDLFSNTAGHYYLKPSNLVIENWASQVQLNQFKGDFRGITGSYDTINGQPVIMKYIYNYSELTPFDKSGKWFLWRAGGLHLRYIEAANRDGQHKIAYALLNNGIISVYTVPSDAVDLTYLGQTLLPFPYDFDARKAGSGQIPLFVRGLYHRNLGIRGRVYLEPREIETGADSLMVLENQVIDEAALELAYEGQRWGDLVRIAIRRNDPSFLADKIYLKLQKGGYAEAEQVREKLSSRDGWFLPLTFE
jgi:tetratricopeptide (TPR) repeat protein